MSNVTVRVCGQAWVGSTSYAVDDVRSNDTSPTKIYRCTTAGTSAASGGPTGTGSGISDGTCVWNYVGTADYTTLNGALSGASSDLRTNCAGSGSAGILTVECYNGTGTGGTDTTAANTGTGYGTSSSYYINITVPSYRRHAGVYSTSKYLLDVAGTSFTNQESYTQLHYLQINCTSSSASAVSASGGANAVYDSLIVRTTSACRYGIVAGGTGSSTYNCLIYGAFSRDGLVVAATGSAYNCTVYGLSGTTSYAGIAVTATSGTGVSVVNCISCGNTTTYDYRFVSTPATLTNNADEDSTLGTDANGNLRGLTVANQFTNAGSGDFSVKNTSANIYNAGTSSGAPVLDITGYTRTGSWDIGAFELLETPTTGSWKLAGNRMSLASIGGLAG